MTEKIKNEHKFQLEEMKKSLIVNGSKEENFLKVELLFFESMRLARTYGDDMDDNGFLAALKNLQAGPYQETQMKYNKSIQREKVIRKFANQLKAVFSQAIRNCYFTPQLSA